MAKKKINRTQFRIKLIKRIEKIERRVGFIGSHGMEMMTEKKLEEFVEQYENENGEK